ncbi:MAG: beta-galactosidase [Lentisphaeria bacterium]|nr:beta-galactosidase [Lentisphaeria bacterium]
MLKIIFCLFFCWMTFYSRAAENKLWLTGDDLEINFSFSAEKPLTDKIHPLLRAVDRKTVLGIVLRQYPGRKQILFNTVRLQKDNKYFVLEFFHPFEPGKTYAVKLAYQQGTARLFLDGKLVKSRSYTAGFVPGRLEVTAQKPLAFQLGKISGAAAAAALPAAEKAQNPWRVTGKGLTVKSLGNGRYRLDYDGKGYKGVLWSTRKCTVREKGEHIRARGRYTILKSEYGSMFRFRLNNDPQQPVCTMSGDRHQDPWTQTKPVGTPDRFDFSTVGRPGVPYALNIEFYGNPQSWILEDVTVENTKIVRSGRPESVSENRRYDKEKVLASLRKMKPAAARAIRKEGRMELQIDGRKMSPVIYRRGPFYPHWTRYGQFRDAGIDLCYFFAMFGQLSRTHSMGVGGIWLGKDKYDFSRVDEELRVIHAINPRARVIIALCLGVYPGWEKDHPDAVFMNKKGEIGYEITTGKILYYGQEAFRQHARRPNEEFGPCPSYYSDAFRTTSAEAVGALVKHLESTPEGRIVCGIHINGGADGQFFPLDRDVTRGEDHSPAAKQAWSRYLKKIYKNDLAALRKAWNMPGVTFENPGIPGNTERGNDNSGRPVSMRGRDYVLFTSAMMRDLRLALFRAVKKNSGNRLLTGAYYPPGTAGNFHFDDMMRSPETDFLIDIQRTTPAGSFLLHNKLYIGEVDMRVPDVMPRLGNYVFDDPTFRNVVRQAASNIIQREGGLYHLFDIGEAFYYRKKTTDFFGQVRKEHDSALADFSIAPGIGVFWDYQQLAGYPYRASDHLFRLLKYAQRSVLERSGVPFQVYSVRDIFDERLKLPKILFFPLIPAFSSEEISRLRDRARKSGSVIVWGHWKSRTGETKTNFAGYGLYVPAKEPLSLLRSVDPASGVRKGAFSGEAYTVNAFGGRFITWYEKPCRILLQKGDRVLGVYANDGKPGFIRRDVNGSIEYMNGAPGAFAPAFFRTLARAAGTDVLSDNDNVIVMAENGLLTCICERGGRITVTVPAGFRVVASTDGRKYTLRGNKLIFTAADDFEVAGFKLSK